MFNVELKFVCGSLKNWFAAEMKSVEIDEDLKDDFLKNNTPKTCQICDFPIDPFTEGRCLSMLKTYTKKKICLKWVLMILRFFLLKSKN